MKKLSAFILSLLLLLSLCGCNITQSAQPTTETAAKAAAPEPLDIIDIGGRYTDTAIFHGNTLILLMSRIFTDDEYEQNIELKPEYSLIICDVANMRLISDNPLDTNDFDYAQMQFSGDKIAVYDEEKSRANFYDLSGAFLQQADYTPSDPYVEKPKSTPPSCSTNPPIPPTYTNRFPSGKLSAATTHRLRSSQTAAYKLMI